MGNQTSQRAFSQRQLRVGELVKQNLGELFIRNEAKIPSINSKLITVTEVRMTPDLKTARVYVIPLGGVDMKETVRYQLLASKQLLSALIYLTFYGSTVLSYPLNIKGCVY